MGIIEKIKFIIDNHDVEKQIEQIRQEKQNLIKECQSMIVMHEYKMLKMRNR